MTHLRRLNVNRSNLTIEGVKGLQRIPNLEELRFAFSGKFEKPAFALLANVPKLTVLDIRENKRFTDEYIHSLTAMSNLNRLVLL